ncbi:MAG: serine kinase [Anaerolineae bacterium]|nr:serine kinase [Anaerolineae bacterium]
MLVSDIVVALPVNVAAGADGLDAEVTGGYASDLLSCVMAGARRGNVWVTLQAHMNVIAVAALLELACIIITEGATLEDDALARADERGVVVLYTERGTFETVAQLATLGVAASQ